MARTQVLVVGAGPTGLVLASWLAHRGIRVRIVDKAPQSGTTSRALVVHARTLELYRQLGLADAVVDAGLPFTALNLWVRGRHEARVEIGDIGAGITRYGCIVIFPQDAHERLLEERLRAAGVAVERNCELIACSAGAEGAQATLRHGDGREERASAEYVAGCDGARSTIRDIVGVGFPGGTYEHVFYVADVTATGPTANDELHVALDEADFVAVFPLKGPGRARLIGIVRGDAQPSVGTASPAAPQEGASVPRAGPSELTWDDVSRQALDRLRMSVKQVHWFSTYHVHHRVANRFRAGRLFLLGDAAHIHSPVGGQGMNTGIGDAANLAWKLAAVLQQRAHPRLIDTYEPERIAFARRLVATTDQAFKIASSEGPLARVVRTRMLPRVLPALFRHASVRRYMFRTVSQTAIEYRGSPLSRGHAGHVSAGDRLPWVRATDGTTDNYAPLGSLDWQAHVYGEAPAAIVERCRALGVPLHAFPASDASTRAGFRRGAVYLVRPDGYVGFADANGNADALARYVGDWALRVG
ncbi:MAG TPA: FAD-dependent monooxygenase [Casimicrobiaceae bacterium]|jgi:2-polyprenyl-6-methoxyphenol hydroxylase-like FAD-dependent oxidoreductase